MSEFESVAKDSDFVSEIITSIVQDVVESGESKQNEDIEVPKTEVASSSSGSSYTCQICRDSDPPCGKYTLPCSHSFCIDCLTGYLTSKVSDGCVVPKCCYVDEVEAVSGEPLDKIKICNADIPPAIIDSVLEKHDAFLEKYRRFKYIKDNKTARQCPYCGVFNIGTPDSTPHMFCSSCQRDYCYFHSNAHDFTKYPTCELYEASIAEEQKETVEYLRANSKKCPGCSLPVMKSGGCNHMKCQCGVAFCWLCGKQVDDSLFPAHFQWWNPSSCSNLQLDDSIEPSMGRRCCARVLGVLQLIILGPITLASTVASSLLCFSCIYLKLKNDPSVTMFCGRNTMFSNCMSSWGMIWMFLLIIVPLAISLGSVVISVIATVSILCYPCYAIVRLAGREYPWPDSVTRTAGRMYRCFGRCFTRCGCSEGCCCISCCSSSRQATYAAPVEGEGERSSSDFDAVAHAEGERLSLEISQFRKELEELEEGLAAANAKIDHLTEDSHQKQEIIPPAVKGRLCEGAKVEAKLRGEGKFLPGRIKRDRGDGTFDIDYDDGEIEALVKEDDIRLLDVSTTTQLDHNGQKPLIREGDRVEVNYHGKGKFIPAHIRQCCVNGTFDITYDDGEVESRVDQSNIRRLRIVTTSLCISEGHENSPTKGWLDLSRLDAEERV